MEMADRFARLGVVLVEHDALWQPRAFHHRHLPWESDYPALSHYLRQLSYEQAVSLQSSDDLLLDALQPYLPCAAEIRALIDLPCASAVSVADYPPSCINDIPGRKLQQIDAFLAATTPHNDKLIDWCSGKGHLARLAAFNTKKPVNGLEYNAALVADGNALAQRLHLPVSLHTVDVMSDAVDPHLSPDAHVLALHACGDLHQRLLEKVVEHRCQTMSLSPCCFHRIAADTYRPLSLQAATAVVNNAAPVLTRDALRTVAQQTVTAPGYVRRQRETLQAWRLGFDLLQREIRGVDEYLPLPTLPSSLSKLSFADFCRHVAALKQMPLPEATDWSLWQARGRQRFEEVTKLDLARLAFRRAMEVWLVLDRAQYLREQGYRVDVLQFCEPRLTPRNILLMARDRSGIFNN